MALADYDTAAEKIAALKCATIDPALTTFQISSLSVTETIYLVTHNITHDGHACSSYGGNALLSPKVSSGHSVAPRVGGGFLYVKDSDIIYPDPVAKYADRLATIATTDVRMMDNFSVGSSGLLVVYMGLNSELKLFKSGSPYTVLVGSDGAPVNIPLKPYDTAGVVSGDGFCACVTLPADW